MGKQEKIARWYYHVEEDGSEKIIFEQFKNNEWYFMRSYRIFKKVKYKAATLNYLVNAEALEYIAHLNDLGYDVHCGKSN